MSYTPLNQRDRGELYKSRGPLLKNPAAKPPYLPNNPISNAGRRQPMNLMAPSPTDIVNYSDDYAESYTARYPPKQHHLHANRPHQQPNETFYEEHGKHTIASQPPYLQHKTQPPYLQGHQYQKQPQQQPIYHQSVYQNEKHHHQPYLVQESPYSSQSNHPPMRSSSGRGGSKYHDPPHNYRESAVDEVVELPKTVPAYNPGYTHKAISNKQDPSQEGGYVRRGSQDPRYHSTTISSEEYIEERRPVFVDNRIHSERYDSRKRVDRPTTNPEEVKDILKSLANPLLGKGTDNMTGSGVQLTSILTNAIKDTATQLISKFGLGKSLELLRQKEQTSTAVTESKHLVQQSPVKSIEKRSLSPLKITTTRDRKISKSRRSRSRSSSTPSLPRSSGKYSKQRSSHKRDRGRHHDSRRDSEGKRRRKRSRSPRSKSPNLDFNDPMMRKVIEDQYPDLAATLSVPAISTSNHLNIITSQAPQMIVSSPMMPLPSPGQLPPPPLHMPGQILSHPHIYPPPIGMVQYAPHPHMPLPTSQIAGMAFLPPPQLPLPSMPSMQPLPPPPQLPTTKDSHKKPSKKSTNKPDESELQCKPCNVKYKTLKPFCDHLETSIHKARFKTFVDDAAKNKKTIPFCNGCSIVFDGVAQYNKHLKGELHKKRTNTFGTDVAAVQEPPTPRKSTPIFGSGNITDAEFGKTFCYDCRTKFNSEMNLLVHKQGPKHTGKIKYLHLDPHPPPQQFCHLCNMWFPNDQQLNKHITLLLHTKTRTIFEKYGIPIPGEDFAVNPKRNITVVVDDDESEAMCSTGPSDHSKTKVESKASDKMSNKVALNKVSIRDSTRLESRFENLDPEKEGKDILKEAQYKKEAQLKETLNVYDSSDEVSEAECEESEPPPPGSTEVQLPMRSIQGSSKSDRSPSRSHNSQRYRHHRSSDESRSNSRSRSRDGSRHRSNSRSHKGSESSREYGFFIKSKRFSLIRDDNDRLKEKCNDGSIKVKCVENKITPEAVKANKDYLEELENEVITEVPPGETNVCTEFEIVEDEHYSTEVNVVSDEPDDSNIQPSTAQDVDNVTLNYPDTSSNLDGTVMSDISDDEPKPIIELEEKETPIKPIVQLKKGPKFSIYTKSQKSDVICISPDALILEPKEKLEEEKLTEIKPKEKDLDKKGINDTLGAHTPTTPDTQPTMCALTTPDAPATLCAPTTPDALATMCALTTPDVPATLCAPTTPDAPATSEEDVKHMNTPNAPGKRGCRIKGRGKAVGARSSPRTSARNKAAGTIEVEAVEKAVEKAVRGKGGKGRRGAHATVSKTRTSPTEATSTKPLPKGEPAAATQLKSTSTENILVNSTSTAEVTTQIVSTSNETSSTKELTSKSELDKPTKNSVLFSESSKIDDEITLSLSDSEMTLDFGDEPLTPNKEPIIVEPITPMKDPIQDKLSSIKTTYSSYNKRTYTPTPQPATQHAPQPTTQPAPQPATQPATQPVTQPAPQPSPQPATQPATQPTTQSNNELYDKLSDEEMDMSKPSTSAQTKPKKVTKIIKTSGPKKVIPLRRQNKNIVLLNHSKSSSVKVLASTGKRLKRITAPEPDPAPLTRFISRPDNKKHVLQLPNKPLLATTPYYNESAETFPHDGDTRKVLIKSSSRVTRIVRPIGKLPIEHSDTISPQSRTVTLNTKRSLLPHPKVTVTMDTGSTYVPGNVQEPTESVYDPSDQRDYRDYVEYEESTEEGGQYYNTSDNNALSQGMEYCGEQLGFYCSYCDGYFSTLYAANKHGDSLVHQQNIEEWNT